VAIRFDTCRPKSLIYLALALSALLGVSLSAQNIGQVRVTEAPLVIPTYSIGPAEKTPVFYSGLAYQGAQRRVYPYPMQDIITDHPEDKTYKAIYLENDFIGICILPELGGRIFIGKDKTDSYEFFYRQHVIKPALIGMTGAWISGGVEWDVPHHHRASSFMPVDFRIEDHPDGSKTVWVGEMELRDRMNWRVGITLYPGRSYVEGTVKIMNDTPVANSMLYFANIAVSANQDYQVIFPPSTQYATYHAKNQFLPWPISDREFGGRVLDASRDMSWWKSHDSSTSWFAWSISQDFFGGYDHGRDAGVVHVADHNLVPGKKFFTWGTGDDAMMWEKVLTDHDGPYLELMAGGYSDNQPDYSWLEPYETRTFREYWYPVRQMGGFKNANREAAVNLQMNPSKTVLLAFNTTSEFRKATIQLRKEDDVIFEKQTDIAPDKPFSEEISLPVGTKEENLTASLRAADGTELISYTPTPVEKSSAPQPVTPPLAPRDIKTVEELYLTGLRLVQFHSPARDPYQYFEEALRRDPGDSRTNTELGILYCKRFMYAEAESYLRTAVARLTHDYTRPKDGEAYYYLGLALQGQGKIDEAYDAFYRATWSEAWQSSGFYRLAMIDSARGKYDTALDYLSRSLVYNAQNSSALNLETSLLRKLGRHSEAQETAREVLKLDKFNLYAANELFLMQPDSTTDAQFWQSHANIPDQVQPYLEVAVQYGDTGFWDDAISVITRWSNRSSYKNPMVEYFLGYFYAQKGDLRETALHFQIAGMLPTAYVFPFRAESLPVLQRVVALNPKDAHAFYYLGNLLYDKQPEAAIHNWEQAAALDPSDATIQANLAVGYWRAERDPAKAIPFIKKAVLLDKSDGYLMAELDQIQQQAGIAAGVRLASLENNKETVLQRDDTAEQLVNLYIETGAYDQAIHLLTTRHFHVAEGGGEIHDSYISAFLLRGRKGFNARQYRDALADFESALQYPDNLEVGRPLMAPRDSEIQYCIGNAQQALGEESLAKASYEKATAARGPGASSRYYQALAFQKLSRNEEASTILQELVAHGRVQISAMHASDFFAKFGAGSSSQEEVANAHYAIGLGLLGLGNRNDAEKEFSAVLALDPNHLGALTRMAELNSPHAGVAVGGESNL
jgi:tetratricopeptide (TPR) repeat protein